MLALSPSGRVARIRLDQIADSYVLVAHLEPAEAGVALEPGVLTGSWRVPAPARSSLVGPAVTRD